MSDDMLKAAIEITKAQAAVREMKSCEVQEYLQSTFNTLVGIAGLPSGAHARPPVGNNDDFLTEEAFAAESLKSIKDKQVTCLVCGKVFKMITKKHLATHGLTLKDYLAKYNLPKKTKLVCRNVQKERRVLMTDLKLWERKGRKKQIVQAAQPVQ